MRWWLADPGRAQSERHAIAELMERSGWLVKARWRVAEGLALVVDFDLLHRSETFALTMTYSALHPHVPPSVVPRDGRRLSGHQYGNGQLCLEYRTDNWLPSITGAMMVESAHRLLAGERAGDTREVPSAHSSTLGQRMRGVPFRFMVSRDALVALRRVVAGRPVPVIVGERRHGKAFLATPVEIDGATGMGMWGPGLTGSWEVRVEAVSVEAGMVSLEPTLTELTALLRYVGLADLSETLSRPGPMTGVILVVAGDPVFHLAFDGQGGRKAVTYTTLTSPETPPRLPSGYAALSTASVGVVGAGSLGSKVAVSLARAGVRRFVLVDDDLLMPDNLVRNELDQGAIGVHKVEALEARLTAVVGTLDVTCRRVMLGGQESSGTTELALADLGCCDVVVDVTADPNCFNFCAAVARAHLRPMVWGEVFAGGIGGIVARVRPGHEPEPQEARNQLHSWCEAHGRPVSDDAGHHPYGAERDGVTLVADDAEVSVVAAHLARIVTDVLVRPGATIFPSPAYALGMARDWIFSAPFEAWPINFHGDSRWSGSEATTATEESLALLRELFPVETHDDNQPAR